VGHTSKLSENFKKEKRKKKKTMLELIPRPMETVLQIPSFKKSSHHSGIVV
jgi:hypothetical protein